MRPFNKSRDTWLRVVAPAFAALALHCVEDPSNLRGGPGGRSPSGAPADDADPTEVSDAHDGSVAESAPTQDAGGAGGPVDAGSSPAEICVAIINEHRRSLNAPPLQRWIAGESCAAGQATSDKAANKPHGAFPGCGESGQNECLGLSSPLAMRGCLNAMWAEGPGGGHYENMRSTRFTSVACGFGQPTNGGWAVQNFR